MAPEEMVDRSRPGLLLTTTEGQILRFEPYIPFLVGGCHQRVQATTRGVGVQTRPGGSRGVGFWSEKAEKTVMSEYRWGRPWREPSIREDWRG